MNGQTMEHPEGRTTEPQHCPRCGRFGHLQYHAIIGGKYQFSKYLCKHEVVRIVTDPDENQADYEVVEVCGEFLKQLETVDETTIL